MMYNLYMSYAMNIALYHTVTHTYIQYIQLVTHFTLYLNESLHNYIPV